MEEIRKMPQQIRYAHMQHRPIPSRLALAINPATTTPKLTLLATDPASSVRAKVAANPNITQSVLRYLSKDPAPNVRSQVAANPLSPGDAISAMAGDTCWQVRAIIGWRKRQLVA